MFSIDGPQCAGRRSCKFNNTLITYRNAYNMVNTQTVNIQNFAQGSIENIETYYSSQVPESRSLSRPLSHEHSCKMMRWGWAACHLPIHLSHLTSAGTGRFWHLSSLHDMVDAEQKERSYILLNSEYLNLLNFLLLLVSCLAILWSLRTYSLAARCKALSTCISHITVVVLLFAPRTFVYMRPAATLPIDKAVAVLYTIIAPTLNHLIYALRNAQMTNTIRKFTQ